MDKKYRLNIVFMYYYLALMIANPPQGLVREKQYHWCFKLLTYPQLEARQLFSDPVATQPPEMAEGRISRYRDRR